MSPSGVALRGPRGLGDPAVLSAGAGRDGAHAALAPARALLCALLVALIHGAVLGSASSAAAAGPTVLLCGLVAHAAGLWPPPAALRRLPAVLGLLLAAALLEAVAAPGGRAETLAAAVGALVLAPCVEEVVYRGFVFEGLRAGAGRAAAVLGSATLFALAHGDRALAPEVLLGGLALSVVRCRSGSLALVVLLHGLGNGLLRLAA